MSYLRKIRQTLKQARSVTVWWSRLVFWGGAAFVGLLATLLALVSNKVDAYFHFMVSHWAWLPVIITPAGLLVITWATRNLFPGGEGSGIPQAIAALQLEEHADRSAVLSIRIAIGKVLAVVLGLLCGASIGREGPTVHVAASIMYSLHRVAKFPIHHVRKGLVLAGGAAGLAAAFNTPLAGVMFAIEEMSGNFEERINGSLMVAVILAGMTSVMIMGNYTYFGVYSVQMDPFHTVTAILVCGIIGGAAGGLFSVVLVTGGRRINAFRLRHPYLLALGCGLAVAAIGIISHNTTWGTGYGAAKSVLEGTNDASPWFGPLKFLATLFSYLSGIPGGIFAPSLAVGAGLGYNLSAFFPHAPMVAIGLLSMVAYFSGVVQTPITAVIIVAEMTGDYSMLLPLMATSLLADAVSKLICPEPIYQAMAKDFLAGIKEKPARLGSG